MLGRVGQRAQDRPDERCVALFLDPGREVIRYGRKFETSLLGAPDVAHEIGRAVLLRHQLVAELDHWCRLSAVDSFQLIRRCPWPSARHVRSSRLLKNPLPNRISQVFGSDLRLSGQFQPGSYWVPGWWRARHATRPAMRVPSRALPRRRALCTNWKKPRYKGSLSCEMPRCGRSQERSSDQKPSMVLT